MEYQQASPATTFSKKLANGGGLAGKHVYDGVFGGAVKPGSRMEDYREIFGGSATCSIPILDFPELNERNISMEARGLKPDYSTIFGGCEEADFAVPCEELFSKPKRVKSRTQEARVPAEARCPSAAPKHSNSSEEKRAPLPEVSSLSFDDVKQFNLSYSKSNPGIKSGAIGTTHIAQLHAVPGYTCLIDEQATQQLSDDGKAVHTTLNDARLNVNASEGIKARKPAPKAVSGPQPRESIKDTSINNSETHKKSRRNKSFANDISFDTFEVGLGTRPSTMSPLNIGSDIGSSIRSMNSKFEAFRSDDSEGAAGSYSPPLLDEEVDANSAAAASAAAVRKAIEEAQAKIKIAKQLMERKKQGLPNNVKTSFTNGSKAKRREMKAAEKINTSGEEAQEMHPKDIPKQVSNGLTEHHAIKPRRATWDFSNMKEPSVLKAAIRESSRAQADFGLQTESGNETEGFSIPAGVGEVNQEVNAEKIRPYVTGIECKEKMTGLDDIKKPMDGEKRLKIFEENLKQEKGEREINPVGVAFQWDIYRHNIKSAEELHQLEEIEEIARVVDDHDEALLGEYRSRRPTEPDEDAEFVIHELEENIYRKKTKDAVDHVGYETRQREAENREEMEIQSNEVPSEVNEKRLDEIHRCEGNGRGQKEDFNRTEYERKLQVYEGKQQEYCHQEENEKGQIGDPKPEGIRELLQVHTEEVIGASLNSFQDEEDSQKRQRENYGTESDGSLVDSTESESMLKEDCHMNEIGKHKTYEDVESERIQTEIHLGTEDKNSMEVTEQISSYQKKFFEATNYVYKLFEKEKVGKTDEAFGEEVKFEGAEATAEVAVSENVGVIEHSYPEEIGRESEVAEEADDKVAQENVQTGETEQGLVRLDKSKKNTADTYLTDLKFDDKQNKYHTIEYEGVCQQEFHFEEVTSQLDENDCGIGFSGEESESNLGSYDDDRWFSNGIDPNTLYDPEKQQVEEAGGGLGDTNQDTKEPEVHINHEEDETYFESSSEEECVNNSIDVQASQQPHSFDAEEKIMKVPHEEEEEKKVQVSQEGRTNQNIDKDENYQETQTTENRETEDNLQKEVELGNEHRERKEEMRMKEMEKEKERMAVERAIREVRERAFAEARERAERAAAEKKTAATRQKTMAEAKGRSEKVCAETNSKSAVEKASVEAKLRAQRAAVERATAEARERALEKALSEKASFKMRNQSEKSASEKVSGASRDHGIKPNDQQNKGSAPSKSSGTNSELPERCKATFERNQRTAERAAKALAEKNMRDLLAQKEQAERNRLAEMLDAEVKRWSSGKERNLRALLSTLQYILGSDSGWQSVPLTDLISTAAVKKAYRKATLLVHPDKLQQRGASIQQKYTCEKVFDLLKDAWNKFSAEER
ncbi:auxilin-like protein 1 [Euphorbia lathyris]|uniref:auxilin-like protein 1 n=1 Tax=Euphorbia lathyris TaxID=212925 RepID=UPI003313FF9F